MKPGEYKDRIEETYEDELKAESKPSWIPDQEEGGAA